MKPLLLLAAAATLPVFSQSVPATINYQGRLTDNTAQQNPLTAPVNMSFEIWDAASGGSRQWVEPASGSTPIPVSGGIFTVLLGASAGGSSVPIPATLFSSGTTRYLQLIINGETLTPRQMIGAAGYANQAENAATAATATNSGQLGLVAAANWQRALSPASCPAGTFYNAISQAGTAACASPQTAIIAPLALSGGLSGPVISATNSGFGAGLTGAASASGIGVYGSGGTGVYGSGINNYGVYGTTSVTGSAGVYGTNTHVSSGYGVYGSVTGGQGVFGVATSGWGVHGLSTSNNGVYGESSTGMGVVGQTSAAGAAGVRAVGSGSAGTALQIENGAIRVVGAGNNTATAAFQYTAGAGCGAGSPDAVIANAQINGNPGVILIVTPVGSRKSAVSVAYDAAGAVCGVANSWVFSTSDLSPIAARTFNILVINP